MVSLFSSLSAFAAIYIGVSGMASLKKKNIIVTLAILFGFAIAAYIANIILEYNYMFLMNHDGTPYQIFYQLVNGNPVLYPLLVVLLFVLCIVLFYFIAIKIKEKKAKKAQN